MWQYGFMQHAFEAGTIVAIVAGIVGYFIVLRRSSFAAHALAHIGFAGAAGAVLFGIAPIIGLLLFTGCGGITIAILGRRAASRDTQIGIVLSFMLGLGVLFISLYSGYATEAYSILFGEILGISNNDVIVTLVASLLIIFSTAIVYRPLLFSSLDEEVAEVKGIAYAFAWNNFHADGRSCDICRRSSRWCPPYFLINDHASSDRSSICKTTQTRHNDLHIYCSNSDVAWTLHFVL